MYLIHYGVKGMKWGVRKAKPSSSYRRFYFRKIDSNDIIKNRPITKDVRSRTKHDIRVISEIQKYDDKMRKSISARNFLNNTKILSFKFNRIFDKMDTNEMPLKRRNMTKDEDLVTVNPSKKTKLASSGNNCSLCTITYDLRRRGFDVIAKQKAPIDLLYDIGAQDFKSIYKGAKEKNIKSMNSIDSTMKNEPNGSRGAIFATWSGGNGGHVVAYEKDKNHITLYDAQSGKKYERPSELFDEVSKASYMRLDNITPDNKMLRLAIE